MDQGKPGVAEVPAHFHQALDAIAASEPHFIMLNRKAAIDPGFVSPEEYAEKAYASLFADPTVWTGNELTRFFRWAVDRDSPRKFALVLATMNALRDGDFERAAKYSRKAFLLLPDNLFIQKLDRLATRRNHGENRIWRSAFAAYLSKSIETVPDGNVHFCCPAWLPVPIGNLNQGTHEEIWNSPTAQAIRQSIHDGSYRYCSRVHCAHLSSNSLPTKGQIKLDQLRAISQSKSTRLEVAASQAGARARQKLHTFLPVMPYKSDRRQSCRAGPPQSDGR